MGIMTVEVGARAGRQDRVELRGERAGGGEERAQAFGAGERRDLVAGEVEQPDHGALAREQAEDRARAHARCSSRDGQPRAPVNGISVRSRPTPAAPLARPSRVSAAEATLHSIVTELAVGGVRLPRGRFRTKALLAVISERAAVGA